jgi:hypothetical protein
MRSFVYFQPTEMAEAFSADVVLDFPERWPD